MPCAVLALLALGAGACLRPPRDTDATAAGARVIRIGNERADSIECSRRRGDCADWYRIPVDRPGLLAVTLVARAEQNIPEGIVLDLRDASGAVLQSARIGGGPGARLMSSVAQGPVFMSITAVRREPRLPYYLQVAFDPQPAPLVCEAPPRLARPLPQPEPLTLPPVAQPAPPRRPPPPPPPPRRVALRSGSVLELEGRDGESQTVLVDLGSGAGIRAGQSGRLVDGGREIAAIVIQEVFAEGSRARIRGALRGTVTPSTVVEIEIPEPGSGDR